jgi:hypothetical protein
MTDLNRRRRRLLRSMANTPWHVRDSSADWSDSLTSSWQTRSSLETSFFGHPEPNEARAGLLDPRLPPQAPSIGSVDVDFARAVTVTPHVLDDIPSSSDSLEPPRTVGFSYGNDDDQRQSTSIDNDTQWRLPVEGLSSFIQPSALDDVSADNELEEITSTGAEAGSTASLGGDTESMDADGDARSSADIEVGSVGAEVGSTGVGHGAEVGFSEIPTIVIHNDGMDCGPGTMDAGASAVRRGMSAGARYGTRPSENVVDQTGTRRWRRFSRADIRERATDPHSYASSSSSAPPPPPPAFSSWDWGSDSVLRRSPRRNLTQDWNLSQLHFSGNDTSSASVDPFAADYGMYRNPYRAQLSSRRDFYSHPGSGASSSNSNSGTVPPHNCLPDCEICGGVRNQSATNSVTGRRLPWRLAEITFDRLQWARTSGAQQSRWLPSSSSSSFDAVGPGASATDDPLLGMVDTMTDSLTTLHNDIEGARRSVASLQWSNPLRADLDSPSASEFERRVRRLDERVSRMQQRLQPSRFMVAGDPRSTLRDRLRERQERLRAHLNELRSRYSDTTSSSSSREVYMESSSDGAGRASGSGSVSSFEDDVLGPSATISGFGSTGADAVNDLLGSDDRARIVGRLRGFREEIRQMRAEMNRRAATAQSNLDQQQQRRPFASRNLRSLFEPPDIASGDERLQAAINQAIHGAFIANGGEPPVGSNIMDQTYRIQAWDFIDGQPPNLLNAVVNVVVRRAKLHNDSSCDISQDGRLLCTFIQTSHSFSGDVTLGIFSLLPSSRGQCLYTKIFGPNAISVSLSPLNNYVLVGLASKRFTWIFTPKQLVAQVFQLKCAGAGESSMTHVHDIMHVCDMDFRAPVSMNSARWLLTPGEGLVYGTNRGDLHIRRPGLNQHEKPDAGSDELASDGNPVRQSLMQMLGLTVPRTVTTATQTGAANVQRSASTQTDNRLTLLTEHDYRRVPRE